jgi:hypothetical protein
MENTVALNVQLSPTQAEALWLDLTAQYAQQLNEHWYDDRFRLIPDGLRHDSIRKEFPAMEAQKRLIGALRFTLGTAK